MPVPDTVLSKRLVQILLKLNDGLALNPKGLAEEFSISLRTAQRYLGVWAAEHLAARSIGIQSCEFALAAPI